MDVAAAEPRKLDGPCNSRRRFQRIGALTFVQYQHQNVNEQRSPAEGK